MEKATRRISVLLNATTEIAADEMNEDAGIPYSYPAQCHRSHYNNDVG
jgi:hypothetical protein